MKRYFALSLLVVNVACAEKEGWREWGAQKAHDAHQQVQGLYTQVHGAVTDMLYGKEESVPTAEETEKKVQQALDASHQTEEDLRQIMKHERTATEGKLYEDIASFMFLIQQCEQPGSECNEKQLAALKADMHRLLSEITSETLVARDILQKRHKQAGELQDANNVVQKGYRDGAVIGVDDEEKKKALDEHYILAVRECHRRGSTCDKKYLSQLRDKKNAYEKAWMNQAVDNNKRMIVARCVIDRLYQILLGRSDVDAFVKRYGMTIPEREAVAESVSQEVDQEQEEVTEDMSPVAHDLVKFDSEKEEIIELNVLS